MSILTLWKGIFPSYTAGHPFLGRNVPRLTPDIRFRETTFRGYSDPLQTLNVELGLLPTFGV